MDLNKIYNVDCGQYMKSLPDACINLVVADPPYGVSRENAFSGYSRGIIRGLDEAWDIFGNEETYLGFTREWLSQVKRILVEHGSIFVWGNYRSIFQVQKCLEETGLHYKGLVVWVKRDAPPNVTCRGYAASTEYVLWYCKSKKGWVFNHDDLKKLNNGKQMRDFWDIQRTMTKREHTRHRTQKKYETAERIVVGHSRKNDIVYIPFAGSGTEIVACIRNRRNWLATETDKQYIDEIILPRICQEGWNNGGETDGLENRRYNEPV